MSRILAALTLTAAAAFSVTTLSANGPCDHLQPGTYAYAECMAEHNWG